MTKLQEFDASEANSAAQTRLLFSFLADDDARAELYAELVAAKRVLAFQSRADTKKLETDPSVFRQTVYLVTHPEHVATVMGSASFSNEPYRKLGSGTFMLGLDDKPHRDQRDFVAPLLSAADKAGQALFQGQIGVLSELAWQAAKVQPLKTRNFDLADLAEQVALRFVGFLFGFAQSDHYMLEQTLRKSYRGLNYQIFARHFVSEPLTLPGANAAMGELLIRTAALIDMYQQPSGKEQVDDLARIRKELVELKRVAAAQTPVLNDFQPILHRLSAAPGVMSTAERAVIAVGLMVGTVGNIQGAVSMIVDECLRSGEQEAMQQLLASGDINTQEAQILAILSRHPPAAFLPRIALEDVELTAGTASNRIPQGAVVILGMGAGDGKKGDPVFAIGSLHACIGKHIALPVVMKTVTNVLGLEGLARTIDAESGEPAPLRKLWGFKCESFPLQFERENALIQQPLHVVMRVKAPVAFHAEALKTVIKYGAPRIELKLNESRHVHFAWFQFIENDAKLALMTVYDGAFDTYIQHFASQIGPLFDLLFEHLEDAPPRPTEKFPREFVNTIRRFNVAPIGGYFFSAYPTKTVTQINPVTQITQ